jgi:hypothetical protein
MISILDTKCHPPSGIRATCGHEVSNKLAFCVSTKDTTIDYDADKYVNCVSYQAVCLKCFIDYLVRGEILLTKRAENKWLRMV